MRNHYKANVNGSRKEMTQVGRVMAERLNRAQGTTAVVIPLKGWSICGGEGGPLYNPQGYKIFAKNFKRHLKTDIRYEEIDAHIKDRQFANACTNMF